MKRSSKEYHSPVMVEKVVDFLQCRSDRLYIDATVGGSGHSQAILNASKPSGKLLCIDRDPDAVNTARECLSKFGDRVQILHGAFSKIRDLLSEQHISCADGILLDLGVSSYQLDTPSRGFGFKISGILDMRMDQSSGRSAADVLQDIDESELSQLIFDFGEERYARRIAHSIVTRRKRAPIETTDDLADVVLSAIPAAKRRGRIHPATRTFQALRIYVNDELGELKKFLDVAPLLLCPGGRLVIMSYHSLEDRFVKRAFRMWKAGGGYQVITKKIVTPSEEEQRENPRSRSAKLRVLERLSF
jgi:16S rRNA (cytosine1402-N4)-methyltransferase